MDYLEEIRKCISGLGFPPRDVHELPTSEKRFPDGANWRSETPIPQTVEEIEELFVVAEHYNMTVNKITECRGIMFNTDEEIIRMCEICKQHGTALFMTPGPRANYDVSPQGVIATTHITMKIRGIDQIVNAIADCMRAVELGVRGIRVTDEGLLLALHEMRKNGLLPSDLALKVSSSMPIANALALKFWTDGSKLLRPEDTINVVRDLTLPMMAAMRAVTDHPLDIHAHHGASPPVATLRTLDTPEIVRVASPVYIKTAGGAYFQSGSAPTYYKFTKFQQFKLLKAAQQAIERYYPDAKQSEPGAKGLAIPARPRPNRA